MALIAGIDEAGRGPLIGPLVIALFSCASEQEAELNKLCQKDSKQLTPAKREEIFDKLRHLGKINFVEVEAKKLNELMKSQSLNDIEAMFMAKLIKTISSEASVKIDLPDRYSWVFARRMKRFGVEKYEAEHKADENHPVVAAASICAKVIRDRKIAKIRAEVGEFGSGYPGDKKTREFISTKENLKKLKPYLRTKWKTLETIQQTKLELED
ncbi:ribonuclease HII [Candidatus Micrarchaeota archaeon]|nr:ribonuclease HII [Candidatus Micrarchaeota archaeon]